MLYLVTQTIYDKPVLLFQNEDKEKQKSEAKHINLRKRKALSDLFRYLTKLGTNIQVIETKEFSN